MTFQPESLNLTNTIVKGPSTESRRETFDEVERPSSETGCFARRFFRDVRRAPHVPSAGHPKEAASIRAVGKWSVLEVRGAFHALAKR